jgi:hypothetical protein
MLETTVDLLNALFLISVILLTAACIVGSIFAALRAVSRGTATAGSIRRNILADIGSQSGGLLDNKPIGSKDTGSHLDVSAPDEDFKSVSPRTGTSEAFPIGTYRL